MLPAPSVMLASVTLLTTAGLENMNEPRVEVTAETYLCHLGIAPALEAAEGPGPNLRVRG
jgi:hypothetical protein